GFGFLDAVPDVELRAIAAFEQRFFPETAGRVAIVHNIAENGDTAGKFGFKAMVPSVHQFAGDAYVNEMGITNPEFPNESCPQGNCDLLRCNPRPDLNDDGHAVVAFTDFMTFIAPPARGAITPAVRRGRYVFAAIGCNRCHWSTLVTDGSPVGAIQGKVFHPFTDLLLHDMGSLGDGISLGSAGLTEMRTTPLWGLRVQTEFLHDGRARTLTDAIAAHDGQG